MCDPTVCLIPDCPRLCISPEVVTRVLEPAEISFQMRLNERRANQKIIFLDVDGVLNNRSTWERLQKEIEASYDGPTRFDRDWSDTMDPANVVQLGRILEATDAKIVISSAWRYQVMSTVEKANARLAREGLPGDRVIGLTPTTMSCRRRSDEITAWLTEQGGPPPARWVALDDDPSILRLGVRALLVPDSTGLTQELADTAILILNKAW